MLRIKSGTMANQRPPRTFSIRCGGADTPGGIKPQGPALTDISSGTKLSGGCGRRARLPTSPVCREVTVREDAHPPGFKKFSDLSRRNHMKVDLSRRSVTKTDESAANIGFRQWRRRNGPFF